MSERPRNWKAMRADRVLAMAENRFGKRFASKEAAIAELAKLPPREQRSLKKVNVSKAERARRTGASERMIAGMSGRGAPSMASKVEELTARFAETMQKPTRDGLAALDRDIKAAGLTAAESQAFAKAIDHPIAKGSSSKILGSISQRLGTLGMFLAKQAAVGGRSAAGLALAVGVGAAAMLSETSGAQAAEKKRKPQGVSKNTVAAKEADAKAKAAEAETERAKTDLRRFELEAEARRDKRMDDRRAADKAPLEQLRQVAMVGVPLAAGMTYGKHKADKINAEVQKAAAAKNEQLKKVAGKVRGSRDPAKLKAGVRVADKLKLGKTKGPLGAVTAGFLATEAVAARVISAHTENETASEVLNGAAIGLGAAAVSTVGTRMVQRATSSVMPNAAALVEVEAARETLKAKKPAPKAKAPRGGAITKAAGRAVLPVLAGVAAVTAFNAGTSKAEAAGADATHARAEGSTEAAKAVTDLLTFGAGAEVEKSIAEGRGRGESVARGAAKGAINLATFGVADMANDALADQGGVASAITDTVAKAAGKVGEMFGWSDAAREASAEARAAKAGSVDVGAVGRDLARELFGGTAHASEQAAGPGNSEPSISAQIGGIAIGGVGGAMVLTGYGNMKAPKAYNIDGRMMDFQGNPITAASKVKRIAKGVGTIGVGLTLASLGFGIAVAGKGKASSDGKAFLNEGAERKAAETPRAPASTVVAASAMPKKSDGQTAGYTRRNKSGQAVQVKAYRTPDRR